jgi:hypothetical protein
VFETGPIGPQGETGFGWQGDTGLQGATGIFGDALSFPVNEPLDPSAGAVWFDSSYKFLNVFDGLGWSTIPAKAYLVMDGNGNTDGLPPNPVEILDNGVNIPHFSENGMALEGHVFSHWNTDPDDLGDPYSDEDLVTSGYNLKLYAIWDNSYSDTVLAGDVLEIAADGVVIMPAT